MTQAPTKPIHKRNFVNVEKKFGTGIAETLVANSLKKEAVAEKAGIELDRFEKILDGEVIPTWDEFCEIALASTYKPGGLLNRLLGTSGRQVQTGAQVQASSR